MWTMPKSQTRAEASALRRKYYFSGRPCRAGHLARRITRTGRCESCDVDVAEARRQIHRRFLESHPDHAARERAKRMQRAPVWADHSAITAVYAEARRRRKLREDVHVDHVIPLRGRLVSGLHVAGNLQILPARLNVIKNNKFMVGA